MNYTWSPSDISFFTVALHAFPMPPNAAKPGVSISPGIRAIGSSDESSKLSVGDTDVGDGDVIDDSRPSLTTREGLGELFGGTSLLISALHIICNIFHLLDKFVTDVLLMGQTQLLIQIL